MKVKLMLGFVLIGVSLPVMANQDVAAYLGVDVKRSNTGFKPATGDKLIQTNYPQGNFFAGVKFNEYLALEFGYESTVNKSRTAFVTRGAQFFGMRNPTAGVSAKTKTKIAGPHVNIVGFYPILQEYCVNLFASFGLTNLKLKSQLDYTIPPDPTVVSRTFSKTKLLPRVTLGIQHMITNNLGTRVMATWEKTSSFRSIYAKNSTLYMQPKDSRSFGLGVFYSF